MAMLPDLKLELDQLTALGQRREFSAAMRSAGAIIEFRGVDYTIGAAKILDNLNLLINKGETLVLLGESGCGKTTTLKLINRLIEPTDGAVLVENKSTADWDAIKLRRRIGYV